MNKFNNWSLCCISKTLSDNGTNFKTMTYKQFSRLPRAEAMKELCQRIAHNFKTTEETIRFCQLNGIAGYRLSSSLCPLLTHPEINLRICELPNFGDILYFVSRIKNLLNFQPLKISAHPSEYISLSSEDEKVIANSVQDLQQHAEIFDLLELPQDYSCPMNIHVRKEGDPSKISSVVMRNYSRLPDNIRNRLVFENNDNPNGTWSIQNLYRYFHEPYGIPLTFDTLHHSILPGDLCERDAFLLAHSTWRGYTPVFHYSEGIEENGKITRKHRDTPISKPEIHNPDIYFDVELKDKCHAIFKLQQQF